VIAFLISRGGVLPSKPCTLIYTALGAHSNTIDYGIHASYLPTLTNEEATNQFQSTRGIIQGCPLSPYLFVVAINELSIALQNEMNNTNLTGVTLGPGCPPIHSLLFAEDTICG
jgi:hypothetical protein